MDPRRHDPAARNIPSEAAHGASPGVEDAPPRISRRTFLVGGGATAVGGLAAGKLLWDYNERFQRAAAAVVKAPGYDADLEQIVRGGLTELGIGRDWIAGKSVLLKPNLVEPSAAAPHVNTHPALIRAVAEVFRRWDASEVLVAEGQGHVRDTHLVLEQSGLEPVLREAKLRFVDLNTDDVFETENHLRFSRLESLHLPRTLRRVDRIVSLPKMKTHHWTGVTLSMKNLFGVMPGICYGWPKNVLHYAGIDQSILDIAAAVRPHLAIVDGIIGMEGDGPVMGTPKAANVLVMGTNLPAVDATAARLMGFDPLRLNYLRAASGRLGPIRAGHIEQRGEAIAELAQHFSLPDHPHFEHFRG